MAQEECLICKAPLEYLNTSVEMECDICHKKVISKTRCVNGHFVCDDCHTAGIDQMIGTCLSVTSKNPIEIFQYFIHQPICHMHGPEHHILVGASLLCAYKNAGGKFDLYSALLEMQKRGKQIPGGSCGFWGACGAAISSGIFISIVTQCTPLKETEWGMANLMTSKSLESIGKIGGPRCCKRNSYLAIREAVIFTEKHLGISMEITPIQCTHSAKNNQCIALRCPFYINKCQ